ncbi:MAG: sulfatase [Planctomycetaceae bacterium]
MSRPLAPLFAAALSAMLALDTHAADTPPSVLMIAVDDLNDWVGCLGGHPQAQTPAIDGLAARGVLFANAHCQAPLCNPSRASLLTGLRPSTTGIYALQPGIRQVPALRDCVTLPQYFKDSGYFTFLCGKVFHDGSLAPPYRAEVADEWRDGPGMPRPPVKFVHPPGDHPLMDWGPFPEDDRQQADWKIADMAIEQLTAAPRNRPFFGAVGFRLPHVPCYASQRWFDLYPADSLQLPLVRDNDRDDIPDFAWYLHWELPEPRLSWLRSADQWAPLVRAYLASISFVDRQIGRVLDALHDSGHADSTVIVLWSDHGFHLGEKLITGKNSLWERSTRVPLIFAGPGIMSGGHCTQPAELLDIYPTLVDLCRLEPRGGLEGHSLAPQLADPGQPRPWPAVTTHNRFNHAVRTAHHRYIRYANGAEEFYDLETDPHEWTNRAADAECRELIAAHRRWLPAVNAEPVPGSAVRLLVEEDGVWKWEGKPINPADLQR